MPLTQPSTLELNTLRAMGNFAHRRVLEIGTGDGRLAWPFEREAACWIALDPDADEIALASASLRQAARSNVHLLVGDGRALSFPADSFDVAFLTWSLC